ncbi:hypothetical protein sos41_01800 [Alphaproteobacteria bacterium SO-S41]|nr:hypothetical protein sos41_01800 [Alphaproteobacteria bacterium SO-S41]
MFICAAAGPPDRHQMDQTVTADPADDIDIAASYSRQDTAAVIPLLDALKARGVKVWFDKNIPGGALWEETITRNMRRAKAVVFFASKASLASDRCFDEVSAARTLRKPIIPVLVDHVRMPDDLPDRLVLTLQTRNTVEAWPGVEGDPVETLMLALASFGVNGDSTPKPAQPLVPPAETVSISPPPSPPSPAATPIAGPPAPARSRGLLYGGLLAVVALLATGAGLYASGVIGGSSMRALQVTEAEWCSVSAKKLLQRGVMENGLPALREAAEGGDLDALTLHCLSANDACNSGGNPDAMSAAYASCTKAADQGRWRALYNKGWLQQRGCGATVDGTAAAQSITRAAEGNCAIAQYDLATLYQKGELVGFDDVKAIRWLTAASDQNYPPAMNALANAYALGRGVPEDDTRAAELWHRAADMGYPGSMANYADALERGTGVPQNTGAAITYYRRAAAQDEDLEVRERAENALKRLGAEGPAKT